MIVAIEMPILRSSTVSRAPLLNIQDSHFNNNNNNNNNACPINKEQFEEVLKSVQTTKMPLTLQNDPELVRINKQALPSDDSASSSLTVTPRSITPNITPRSITPISISSSSSVTPITPPKHDKLTVDAAQVVPSSPKLRSKTRRQKSISKSGYIGSEVGQIWPHSAVGGSSPTHSSERRPRLSQKCSPSKEPILVPVGYDFRSVSRAPTPIDHLANLEAVMRDQGCYETPKGLEAREEVLKSLNILVREWIKSIGLGRGFHWNNVEKIGGRIVTYGSYMLGISHQGADIDALCVAPYFISRQNYFTSFYAYLSFQTEVTELRAIEEAYVPVIKFRYNGIEIDMTFTQLNVEQVPTSDVELLRQDLLNNLNLDLKCLRSLNGYRSTMLIMKLVPDVERFRVTLRAVKLWAQGQGLYSNILGYLGGFSWAVLVAKICMDHPQLSAPELIRTFFQVYRSWSWPQPIALTNYRQDDHPSWDMSSSASWNPDKNVQERYQVMPILTPTYPHQNSTFNVTANTLRLIKEKMCVAADICQRILEGNESWETLFQTCHIFHEYEHFLIVVASAHQPATSSQQPIQWFGLIESKIRHLANNLEKDCRKNLSSARVWPKPFAKKAEKTNTIRQLWFIGLKIHSDEHFDHTRTVMSFNEMLFKQSASFFTRDMKLEAHYLLKSQLTSHLSSAEIQEIVSSQSQKARESTPTHVHPAKMNSVDKTTPGVTSSSSYATAVVFNHSYVGSNAVSADRGQQHLALQNIQMVPTSISVLPPLQPPPLRTYYNSPNHGQIPPPLRIHPNNHHHHNHHQHQYPQHQQQRSPIMERTWASSGSAPGFPPSHTSTTKYNYDRATVAVSVGGNMTGNGGHVDYNDRGSSGGESSSSSTAGLDISYSSLESDNGRSVSYSSDKFPPKALINDRLQHHFDRIPFAQLCPPPVASSHHHGIVTNLYGSTPTYDSSVPPPPSPILSKGPTFAKASRPMTLSSQQRIDENISFYDKDPRGRVTSVRLHGCPPDLSLDIVHQWVKLFGQIIDEPYYEGHALQLSVVLDRDIPEILPIEGSRISVSYRGIGRLCFNCFEPGHVQRDCRRDRGNYYEYLFGLQARYNIPANYFKELRGTNFQRSFYF